MHQFMGGVRIDAPAKVNFYLRITGRREDGYHALDTVMQTVSLCDHLEFHDAPDLKRDTLFTNHRALAVDSSNLILRACGWVRERCAALGLPAAPAQKISLQKNIPIGAGLGGGSADAAATLRALERKWNLAWTPADWRGGALALGSDVPFCLVGGEWRCTGRGEELATCTLSQPPALALLCPPYPAATASVYQAYARRRTQLGAAADDGLSAEDFTRLPWREWRGQWRNDLTDAACQVVPQLNAVRLWFDRNQLTGGMSGSGSTFVAACESLQAAAEIGACFEREFPLGRSFAVEPVTSLQESALPTAV